MLENMDSFTKLGLVLVTMMTLILSATCGKSVEPPRRLSRTHRNAPLKVTVNPARIELREGKTVKVKCRVRGGVKVEDMPFIGFYRKLGQHTVMPMSSGFPGVTIQTIAAGRHTSRTRHNRAIKYIKLGHEVWKTLYPGANEFYCKGSKMNGDSVSQSFYVYRV